MISPDIYAEYRKFRTRDNIPMGAEDAWDVVKYQAKERARERLKDENRHGFINTGVGAENFTVNGVDIKVTISYIDDHDRDYHQYEVVNNKPVRGEKPASREGVFEVSTNWIKFIDGNDEESIYQSLLARKFGRAAARRAAIADRESQLKYLRDTARGDEYEVDVYVSSDHPDDNADVQTFSSDDAEGIRQFIRNALDSILDLTQKHKTKAAA